MVRFAAMSWFKPAVIFLCIIGGFVANSWVDRYQYFHIKGPGVGVADENVRIDKWTGEYSKWDVKFNGETFEYEAGKWTVPRPSDEMPDHR